MKIIFDYREKDLIEKSEKILKKYNFENIEIITENLNIGDVIIKDENKELLIIERKTLRDLSCSIKDGRYKEQSMRLNAHDIHNHNVIYLIEGITSGFGYIEDPRVNIKTLYSCMCALLCHKGFSVFRSLSIHESAEIIVRFADKINRENNCDFFYNLSNDNENIISKPQELYSSTIKKVKSENINSENIGEIMLSQIPKISSTVAHEIMLKYKTIKNIIKSYEENNNILDEFTYRNNKDQVKKLTKPAIENIKNFLFNN